MLESAAIATEWILTVLVAWWAVRFSSDGKPDVRHLGR